MVIAGSGCTILCRCRSWESRTFKHSEISCFDQVLYYSIQEVSLWRFVSMVLGQFARHTWERDPWSGNLLHNCVCSCIHFNWTQLQQSATGLGRFWIIYRVSLGNIEPQIKLFLRSIVSDIASSVSKFRTGSMLKRSVFRFFSREVEVHTVHTSKIPKQLGQKQIQTSA